MVHRERSMGNAVLESRLSSRIICVDNKRVMMPEMVLSVYGCADDEDLKPVDRHRVLSREQRERESVTLWQQEYYMPVRVR